MRRYKDVLFLLAGFILGIALIVGCGAKIDEGTATTEEEVEESVITEEEPEETDGQEQAESEDCDSIKSELESLKARYEALQTENSELTIKYNELSDDYDELSVMYNRILTESPDITEDDVEQSIFNRINQEREERGLSELEWTEIFRQEADEHSGYLAEENLAERSELSYMQAIFRAAGYSTLERITDAAMMVWEREQTVNLNLFNSQAEYGIVSAKKSGDIFYIVFFGHTRK